MPGPANAIRLRRFAAERWIAGFVLLLVALRTLDLLLATWPFETDDAFITLRYARHLAAGLGIVWNLGEPPVEGYSNFLFVLTGALAITLGLEPITVLKLVSSAALFVSYGLLYGLTRLWVGPIGAAVPALILSGYVGTIWWTASGLETAVYLMFVLAAVTGFLRGLGFRAHAGVSPGDLSPPRLAIAGGLVCLASLTRPEGPLVAVALGVVLVLETARRASASPRALWALMLAFGIPYAIYFLWRLAYFGHPFPNSVYCKAGFSSDPWQLIRSFGGLAWPFAALALAPPWRRFDVRHATLALVIASYVVILYGVDPIVGHANRHFLTAFALLLVLAVVGVVALIRLVPSLRIRSVAGAFLLVLLLCAWGLWTSGLKRTLAREAESYAGRMQARSELGRWLDGRLTRDDAYVIGDTGRVPYLTRADVIDAYCLNNRETTADPANRSAGAFVERVMQRRPAVIVVHSEDPKRLRPHAFYGVYPRLVADPRFRAGYRHVRTFGAPGDTFHYWVFERRDAAALEAP